jgi:hypothetical protein
MIRNVRDNPAIRGNVPMAIKMALCRNYIVERGGEGEKEDFFDGHELRNIGVDVSVSTTADSIVVQTRIQCPIAYDAEDEVDFLRTLYWSIGTVLQALEVTRNELSPDRIRLLPAP